MKNFNYIKKAVGIIKPKSTVLPILECVCVLDDRLIITDLNTSIIFKGVGIPIDFVQNAVDFVSACSCIENPKFNKTNEKLTISSDEESFTFRSENTDNFPNIFCTDARSIGSLGINDCAIIQRALTVISKDELRPSLCNVALKDNHVLATDGHQAIFHKSDFAHSKQLLFGRKTVRLMGMFPESGFSLAISDSRLMIENDIAIIIQRIDDNTFPDVLAVVPKDLPVKINVDKSDLEFAVKRALLCSDMMKRVDFNVNGRLTISSESVFDDSSYKRQISHEHTGGDVDIAFNGKMFLNLIVSIKSKELAIEVNDRSILINKSALLMQIQKTKLS